MNPTAEQDNTGRNDMKRTTTDSTHWQHFTPAHRPAVTELAPIPQRIGDTVALSVNNSPAQAYTLANRSGDTMHVTAGSIHWKLTSNNAGDWVVSAVSASYARMFPPELPSPLTVAIDEQASTYTVSKTMTGADSVSIDVLAVTLPGGWITQQQAIEAVQQAGDRLHAGEQWETSTAPQAIVVANPETAAYYGEALAMIEASILSGRSHREPAKQVSGF